MTPEQIERRVRELATLATPSRRQNKQRSGRTGRKQYNGQRALQAVGGTNSTIRAIYAPPTTKLCRATPVVVEYFEVPQITTAGS